MPGTLVTLRGPGRPPALGHSPRGRLQIPRDRVSVALALLLGVGLLLRIYFLLVWRPAITGFSDSGIYFDDALTSVWADPIRTVGYSMFLHVLHLITPHLILAIIVQHILGLLAAVLYFLAVRRCGGPRGLGLAPAAIIALGGDELFLEHSALSDSLFIFLLSAMLYCAVRASQGGARWAALAGLCAGLGVWDRGAGLAMVGVIALWLLFSAGRPTRRTIAVGLLSLVVSLASLGVYIEWRHAASGLSGLTTNNAWNLYGRVGPWADCTKFTPPPETRALCETTPPSQRVMPNGDDYIYASPNGSLSPARQLFGPAFLVSKYPHAMALLQKWSEAAILGQPLDYLHAVWLDTIRLFDPNHHSYGESSADQLIALMLYGPDMHSGVNEFVTPWQRRLYPHDPAAHRGDIAPLKEWERITRVDGAWMAILLVLCLAGPWLLVGRARAGMTLFGATALVLLFFPIFTKGYDYRYVIPAFGPLLAAGALAGWGLVVRIRSLVVKIRPKAGALSAGG
jgi:Dolichyl-phosphate-mannose-protein mannosyltransferase